MTKQKKNFLELEWPRAIMAQIFETVGGHFRERIKHATK